VWFDALPNYLTATGYPKAGFETRWPAQLHIIGKDITRHHCVVWPAMLEAAGLPLRSGSGPMASSPWAASGSASPPG